MKLSYEIEADRDCQIPVIGDLVAGEAKTLDAVQEAQFQAVFGYKIAKGNFPPGVKLTVCVNEEGEGE